MFKKYYITFQKACNARNFTDSTCEQYWTHIRQFLVATDIEPDQLTCQDIADYLVARKDSGINTSTLKISRAALKNFFKFVLHAPWDDEVVPRMKIDKHLPHVFSQEEIQQVLELTPNLKHRAILATIYSSGLRISEVRRLRYSDILRRRMMIYVRESKTRRDRYTILSQTTLDLLTQYWFQYGKPKDLLFPGKGGKPMSGETIRKILCNSVEAAKLSGHYTPHDLRHSFATHLLENDVELHHIQTLLGHSSITSTEIYLHVSNKALMGIKSPLDQMGGLRNE